MFESQNGLNFYCLSYMAIILHRPKLFGESAFVQVLRMLGLLLLCQDTLIRRLRTV
jgi:hypothetical protein